LLSGDPAQMSPVGGSPLWCEGGPSVAEQELLGKSIYKFFDQVFYLKKNYRQGSAEGKALAAFLANYREAALTEDDFAWFESRSAEVLSKDGFAKAYDEGCAGVVHARVYVKFTSVFRRASFSEQRSG